MIALPTSSKCVREMPGVPYGMKKAVTPLAPSSGAAGAREDQVRIGRSAEVIDVFSPLMT